MLYISTSTRPDIAFAVNNVARHVTGLGPPHVRALLRIVKYLNGTQSWRIRYLCPDPPISPMQTQGYQAATHPCDPDRQHLMRFYCDADYAQSSDRKSTTGYTVIMNGGPVCRRSNRQKIIAQSTAESEIISATDAGKDVIHQRLLLKDWDTLTKSPNPLFISKAIYHVSIWLATLSRDARLSILKSD